MFTTNLFSQLQSRIQLPIQVSLWLSNNHLKRNMSKTKFPLVSSQARFSFNCPHLSNYRAIRLVIQAPHLQITLDPHPTTFNSWSINKSISLSFQIYPELDSSPPILRPPWSKPPSFLI